MGRGPLIYCCTENLYDYKYYCEFTPKYKNRSISGSSYNTFIHIPKELSIYHSIENGQLMLVAASFIYQSIVITKHHDQNNPQKLAFTGAYSSRGLHYGHHFRRIAPCRQAWCWRITERLHLIHKPKTEEELNGNGTVFWNSKARAQCHNSSIKTTYSKTSQTVYETIAVTIGYISLCGHFSSNPHYALFILSVRIFLKAEMILSWWTDNANLVCLHSGLPLSCWEKLKFQLNGWAKKIIPRQII